MTTARILRDAGFLGAGNHRRTNNINDTTINDTMKKITFITPRKINYPIGNDVAEIKKVSVAGYSYTHSGFADIPLVVHKSIELLDVDSKNPRWRLSELSTGLAMNLKPTRKAAIEDFENKVKHGMITRERIEKALANHPKYN